MFGISNSTNGKVNPQEFGERGQAYLQASDKSHGIGNGTLEGTRNQHHVVRGSQALSVRVLENPPSMQRMARPSAEDQAVRIEDLIKLLDREGANLRRGRYPDSAHGQRIAAMLRRVAEDFDA